jgi:undecaprenyl-diphosphatase
VVLSGLLELGSLIRGEEGETTTALGLVVATLLAFASGYASIAFLLRFLSTHSTRVFVAYRVALGILVLVLVSAGTIK